MLPAEVRLEGALPRMHAPTPSRCTLGGLGVGRAVTVPSPSLCDRLCGELHRGSHGSAPPCCTPAACSQRPHCWHSGLRRPHFPVHPHPVLFWPPSGPIGASTQLSGWCAAACLSQCFARPHCPTWPPTVPTSCPWVPAVGPQAWAASPLHTLDPQRLTGLSSHTHVYTHTPVTVTRNGPWLQLPRSWRPAVVPPRWALSLGRDAVRLWPQL